MANVKMIIILAIGAAFAAGVYFYPSMPDLMASHWGIDGQVNGYMSKGWALFLLPAITLVMVLLMAVLPKFDPLKKNYTGFRKQYDGFIALFAAFMLYVYALTILWNKGVEFNMTQAMAPAFAGLFYYLGYLMENTKQNWFVGIRTPWTMSSQNVWDKTHKLGAKVFKIFAIASLLAIFIGGKYFLFLIAGLLAATLWLVVYSYREYKKDKTS